MTDSCKSNDNQQPGSLVHNMIEDLRKFLISYLEPLNIQVSIWDENIFLEEVFMIQGCLSLFIYNKQDILNETIHLLNNQYSQRKKPFYATIKFINETDSTYFGVIPVIEHNLIPEYDEDNEAIYNPHVFYHNYYLVLNELIKSILSDKCLVLNEEKVIALDSLYESFTHSVNDNKLIIEKTNA